MGKKRRKEKRVTLRFPKHAFQPEDLLHFVELTPFSKSWEDLGLDVENDLLALQLLIMTCPTRGPVMEGTGGLRKLRFSPDSSHRGARGGYRVCYAYFEEFGIVLLVVVYAKGSQDDLSEGGKKEIRKLLRDIKVYLERRRPS